MAEYFVAKSYENYERVGEPFEKSGRMYTKAAERRAKEREETRVQEAIERAARRQAISEANKKSWFEKNGFDVNGITYCVYGDDTYSIKEHLKELGCKFSPLFMWHSPEPIELPEGYGTFEINYIDYMVWDTENDNMIFKEDAKEKIERRFDETKEPSLSEYVGEVGERLRNLTVVFSSRRGYTSRYGWTNIFTFKCGDNVFTWFTSSEPEIEVGNTYDMTATVKKHEEFRSVKTTVVSRCILRAID